MYLAGMAGNAGEDVCDGILFIVLLTAIWDGIER